MTLSELFQKHAVLTGALEEIKAIEAERDALRAELAELKQPEEAAESPDCPESPDSPEPEDSHEPEESHEPEDSPEEIYNEDTFPDEE